MQHVKRLVAVLISACCPFPACCSNNNNIFHEICYNNEDPGKISKIEIYALDDVPFAFPPENYSGFELVLEFTEKDDIKNFVDFFCLNYLHMGGDLADHYPEVRLRNYLVVANQNTRDCILIRPSERDPRIPVIRYFPGDRYDWGSIQYDAFPLFASYLADILKRIEQ